MHPSIRRWTQYLRVEVIDAAHNQGNIVNHKQRRLEAVGERTPRIVILGTVPGRSLEEMSTRLLFPP